MTTPHRDELGAAQARIAALERELAEARRGGRSPLRCGQCSSTLHREHLKPELGLLSCASCGAVVELFRSRKRRPRQPASLHVLQSSGKLEVSWKWPANGLVYFALLVFGSAVPLGLHTILADGRWWLGLFLVASVLPFVYALVIQVLNHTTVTVSGGLLVIEHGPLPTFGNRVLHAGEIEQLFCSAIAGKGGPVYLIEARLRAGATRRLLTLRALDEALYLERILEESLGIVDAPVEGELVGS